jgi:hypothetical protein
MAIPRISNYEPGLQKVSEKKARCRKLEVPQVHASFGANLGPLGSSNVEFKLYENSTSRITGKNVAPHEVTLNFSKTYPARVMLDRDPS